MGADEFRACKTFISRNGVIRTTFERNMRYSDSFDFGVEHMLPVKESYEYKLQENIAASLFEEFDLLELKPAENDIPFPDGGSWQITIYTNGENIKMKGFSPPAPFGERLADKITGLIKYKIDPMLF
ncbi:hypothetical protein Psch_00097 [Pelotomaculum schinkii]|uniref:Uncharacterized protein n=2 Tax=Pelotomaculum schinkii TaxID=78350 RepID=A0A4Y7RC27_9FIRM|nr:hypothetical protein Psch_00097 [Pelotomaculum schinkii]